MEEKSFRRINCQSILVYTLHTRGSKNMKAFFGVSILNSKLSPFSGNYGKICRSGFSRKKACSLTNIYIWIVLKREKVNLGNWQFLLVRRIFLQTWLDTTTTRPKTNVDVNSSFLLHWKRKRLKTFQIQSNKRQKSCLTW